MPKHARPRLDGVAQMVPSLLPWARPERVLAAGKGRSPEGAVPKGSAVARRSQAAPNPSLPTPAHSVPTSVPALPAPAHSAPTAVPALPAPAPPMPAYVPPPSMTAVAIARALASAASAKSSSPAQAPGDPNRPSSRGGPSPAAAGPSPGGQSLPRPPAEAIAAVLAATTLSGSTAMSAARALSHLAGKSAVVDLDRPPAEPPAPAEAPAEPPAPADAQGEPPVQVPDGKVAPPAPTSAHDPREDDILPSRRRSFGLHFRAR
ncbi:MAG: hypothetical protein ACRDZX_07925 [Acidimicrobiales bacterium]